jgi:NAD(P)-dependent dehydrogenase (short-subunit alcohol dehydrogenase family)
MIVNDKTLVVVGGAGRLGRAFVEACKNENAKVYVIDVCDKEKWGTMNVPCDLFVQSDINDPQSLNEAIKQLYANSKHIDCVINTSYPKNESFGEDIMGVSLENFNENVNLHLGGYFHVMQKFTEIFINQGYGNIINIASIQGVAPPKFHHYEDTKMTSPIEYTAAKSAIIAISTYMAKYLAGRNIRVNCISPGGIYANQDEVFLKRYKASCTSKGILDAEDIVGALLFLISDQSRSINGQNIIVDDGWSL